MRIVCDLTTGNIIQSEKTPAIGVERAFNGKFPVDIPVSVELSSTSYVLPVDGGDVLTQSMQALLSQYPMYSHVVFNFLLTNSDIADLDMTAVFPGMAPQATRALVGPGTVCILGQNDKVSPSRPGVLITDTIDISGYGGADEFLLWWKLYDWNTSADVTYDGINTPALRNLIEVDNEPSGLTVYISNDDGANYEEASLMTPTPLPVLGNDVRVAFVNTGTDKRYLAAYAILF